MQTGSIYDDVHRTLVNDQPRLLIAVINEAHGENYTGEEKIVQGHNEHYFKKKDGETDKKITDNYLEIYNGDKVEGYHTEVQSTQDSSMTKRMFEYDVQKVEIWVAEGNGKSRAIAERLGFVQEGIIRNAEWLYDHYVNHVVYGVLRSEWLMRT